MADFDPYAAMAMNPYMQQAPQKPDWMSFLGNALTGIGAGIGQADASGRGWSSGIGPGLMYANQAQAQRQHQAEQEQQRRLMFGLQMAEFGDKRAERERKLKAQEAAANEYAPTGVNYTPPAVRMGPGNYDTKVASLEGGGKNGGMVFNELGSGAYGPYQFMPATYAGVRAKSPGLNLPEDMTKATREQWDQAHNVLKTDNSQGLTAAGLPPTPENLYLAHRFGVGGATSVLRADPSQSLAEVLPIEWQKQNPDMRGQTAGGFRRLAAERVGGSGVPYEVQPNAKPTQYALMPDEMPLNVPGAGITSLLPRTSTPSWAAPVMPQPQAEPGVVPAQYAPPPQAGPAASPTSDAPPQLVLPTRPMLSPSDSARLRTLHFADPARAASEYKQILETQQQVVRSKYEQDYESWKHKRGQGEKDAWDTIDPKNAQMLLGPGYDNGKSYQRNKVTGEIKPVGGAQVQIDMGGKAVTEIAKQRVQQYEEKIRPAAAAAVSEIESTHRFRQLLDAGAFTGVGAGTKLLAARVADTLGLPSDKADNTQALMAAAADRVLASIKSLGANPTDSDRIYLEKAKGGDITFTDGALRKILDIGEKQSRSTIKKHGEEVGRIRKLDGIKDLPDEFFSLSDAPDYEVWSKQNPLPAVAPAAPPVNRPPISSFGRDPQPTMTPNQRPPLSSFGGGR